MNSTPVLWQRVFLLTPSITVAMSSSFSVPGCKTQIRRREAGSSPHVPSFLSRERNSFFFPRPKVEPKQFHRHYSGRPALLDRHYTGTFYCGVLVVLINVRPCRVSGL